MGHFAKVVDGTVVNVIVVEGDSMPAGFVDTTPGYWIQTSYNTINNQHTQGKTPLRGNFAGIGYTYDFQKDVFIPPKPHNSWVFDEEKCNWKAPIDHPDPSLKVEYTWGEAEQTWVTPFGAEPQIYDIKTKTWKKLG